ncbi:glycoside hydrolase family protein [Plantactinospora sp. KBS50]|uniref:glycoside hydrolase family protein n=1 Tax=Plantactinospora sp. KBS50 TaxID=2024580 RepID=UPI001E2ED99D|nr:glycoside hydrolase family protein [Plantactinospora sp. KBS50]
MSIAAAALLAVLAVVVVAVTHRSAPPDASAATRPVGAEPAGIDAAATAALGTPSPSPSATSGAAGTGTPSPSGRSTARAADPAAPASPAVKAGSSRKGVGVWTFDGVSQALAGSTAGWYYTWNVGHQGVTTPKGTEFVPMIWGPGSLTASNLRQAKANGRYLLGFNEPDMGGQANMSVEQALDLWPQLEATGLTLGSPAVAWGGDRQGEWLDRFMSGARQRGYRVDFIALHWYGGDFTTANAVNQLKSYLSAVHARYGLPIWLTEFALIDFSNGVRFPSQDQQAAFLTAATRMLDGLSWLHRYAWFGLPATDRDQSGLFRTGSEATAVGRAFQAAR